MYKEKLRELLKEVPEVKEQMEKWEIGFILKHKKQKYITKYLGEYNSNCIGIQNIFGYILIIDRKCIIDYEFIGLPLSERFIRMYCEKKNILHSFQFNRLDIGCDAYSCKYNIIIDNTKDLENQSETFYNELYESLLELNKLG